MRSYPFFEQGIGWQLTILLSLAVPAILLSGVEPAVWRYDRELIASGQWWRFFSGQFTHLGTTHLWLNLGAWLMMWIYARGALNPALWFGAITLCLLSTALGLWFLSPEVDWYVGLSGMLHGLMIVIACALWRHRDPTAALCLAAVALKLLWEHVHGPTPGTSDLAGGPVLVVAHAYGAAGGALLSMPLLMSKAT